MRGTCGPDNHGRSSSRQTWWCASIVGTVFIASLKLLLGGAGGGGLTGNLRGDLIGLDGGGNAAIHRNQQQHILHLRRRTSVRERALGVDTEFGRPPAGSRNGEHDKAAGRI